MSRDPVAAKWSRLLEDARVWPRRIARASLLVTLVVLAVLVYYYTLTGNKALILAIVIVAAGLPIDLIVLKAVLEGTLVSNALEAARILEKAGATAYASRPVFNGVQLSASLGEGQVHAILKPNTVEAAYIASPTLEPARGKVKPRIQAPERPPRSPRKCASQAVEGLIEAHSIDPASRTPVIARGRGRYAYKACPQSLAPKDVAEALSAVLP